GLDRLEQVVDRFGAVALLIGEPLLLRQTRIALRQGEDVGWLQDAALVVEGLDLLLAQPLDVEGVPRYEMLQPLLGLRRADEAAGAAPHHVDATRLFVHLPHRGAAAGGAGLRPLVGFWALRALFGHHAQPLRGDLLRPA